MQALTPFVGRHRELEALGALLADPACRLLTLLGPGGIGKSRLAFAVADRLAAVFPDGVYSVSLESVSSAALLAPAIAEALELPLAGQDDPFGQLARRLAGKQVLVLLDAFEQLLDAAARDRRCMRWASRTYASWRAAYRPGLPPGCRRLQVSDRRPTLTIAHTAGVPRATWYRAAPRGRIYRIGRHSLPLDPATGVIRDRRPDAGS